jgi:hypothetical protein
VVFIQVNRCASHNDSLVPDKCMIDSHVDVCAKKCRSEKEFPQILHCDATTLCIPIVVLDRLKHTRKIDSQS